MKRGRWLLPTLALLGAAWAASNIRLVQAQGDEMYPSIRDGDWLLLGPGAPEQGDVFALQDPAEPDRPVLRRIQIGPGRRIWTRGSQLRRDGDGVKHREMGRVDGQIVLSESNLWLIARRSEVVKGPAVEVELGEEDFFVMADNRDLGVDSRWWGPVEGAALKREVWLRVGPGDLWRGAWSVGARDGPWAPPEVLGGASGSGG